jgi:CubicO group peptidase (beta-lactamase class C family)
MEPVSGDRRSEQMGTYLVNLTDEGGFMGSVLVAQNGDILLNEGYGQANVGAEIPNLPETQFRIGSLTKQFTAAAILKLQEQGLLNVQDPVAKFLPDYPRGNEITIHHLLTHTGGIPNYERRRDLPEVVQSPIPLDELIASFSGQPLEFPPGQQYRYSSSGYVVLTKIIEIASGQPYADYLENQILIPVNMAYSGYNFLSPDLQNPAEGYHLTPGGARPAILTDSSWPTGAGALYSTVGDLYRWDRALYEDEILSTASRQAFFTPWMDTGQGTDYGYGWDIGTTAGKSSIAHGGGIFGFASFMARFPEDDAVIIVLSNGIQMPPRLIAEGLAQILFSNE